MEQRLKKIEDSISALSGRISALESAGKEIVPVRNEIKRELAAYHKEICEVIGVMKDEAVKEASDKVLTVVDRKIVPAINKTIEWVGYNTQDGSVVVDDYRRNVMEMTGGGKKYGHLRTVFD